MVAGCIVNVLLIVVETLSVVCGTLGNVGPWSILLRCLLLRD